MSEHRGRLVSGPEPCMEVDPDSRWRCIRSKDHEGPHGWQEGGLRSVLNDIAGNNALPTHASQIESLQRALFDARQALSDRDARIRELQEWIDKYGCDHIGSCQECGAFVEGKHKPTCSVPHLLAESSEPANEH